MSSLVLHKHCKASKAAAALALRVKSAQLPTFRRTMASAAYDPASLLQDALQLESAVERFVAGRGPTFKGLLRAVSKEARVARSLATREASGVHAGVREARLQGCANNLGGFSAELDVATAVGGSAEQQGRPPPAAASRS